MAYAAGASTAAPKRPRSSSSAADDDDIDIASSASSAATPSSSTAGKAGSKAGAATSLEAMLELVASDEVLGADLEPVRDATVRFSKSDRDPQLRLSEDGLVVRGHQGFRSCRVNYGVTAGRWFCEMTVQEASTSADERRRGHVRVGWTSFLSPVEAPVGFHASGFGFRDVDGAKLRDGWREPYGTGFREGDVVGMLLQLTPDAPADSHVRFFVNGEDQGVAFSGLEPDQLGFFATASLYQTASVKINPGPKFAFPKPPRCRPLCERAQDARAAAAAAVFSAAAALQRSSKRKAESDLRTGT